MADDNNIQESKESTKYGMEPAMVLLINNETGMFEWQDIPHPSGPVAEGGQGWNFSLMAAALLELQVRLSGVSHLLWEKKIKNFESHDPAVVRANPLDVNGLLTKLQQRGMRRR